MWQDRVRSGLERSHARSAFPRQVIDLLDCANSTPRAIRRVIDIFPERHLVPRLCVIGTARNIIPFIDSDRAVHSDRSSLVGFGTYPYSSFFHVGLV